MDKLDGRVSCSVALVVSPLYALISDQVQVLKAKGITATICSHGRSNDSAESNRFSIAEGKFQIMFVTPEVLFDKNLVDVFCSCALKERLVSFVVDETHCVKKWLVYWYYEGKNLITLPFLWRERFPKEFSRLGGDLCGFLPTNVRFMALTATTSQSALICECTDCQFPPLI